MLSIDHQDHAAGSTLGGLCILGSTGSIGTQTLDIARLFPERFRISALTAHTNVDLLIRQALEFRPAYVVLSEEDSRSVLENALSGTGMKVLIGKAGLIEAVTLPEVETVVAALVGFAGLEPVVAAIRAGKRIALANKETLVVAGAMVNRLLSEHDGLLIPIDSEHSAIFQCLVGESHESIEQLILTASGGPFRTRPLETFNGITRKQALKHPNWSMGAKITIDSATMMNKGLEIIEAFWLFGIDAGRISVVVHPQSIIHSMVLFRDGSTKAQLGVPDMKVPIQYALSYPERWFAPHERIDWRMLSRLEFEEPDLERFPCIRLAFEALEAAGSAPAVLNAANEEAVSLFLQEKIRFVDIPVLIEAALTEMADSTNLSIEELVELDSDTRRFIKELIRPATI